MITIIAVATAFRLILARSIGPGNDEAYYSLYLDHPDWSYFDHPPMVAVVARLGRWLDGREGGIVSLRAGFIVLFAASSLLAGRIARSAFGQQAEAPTVLALNVSWYFGAAVGTFVLPDGPLLFFWLLTMDRIMAAVSSGPRIFPWVVVGIAWGSAMLSKYHGILLPIALIAFLVMEPTARRSIRSTGPILAMFIGLVIFSPVIAWNACHGWESFVFQGARAVGTLRPNPGAVLGTIGAQVLYLMPWTALGLVRVVVQVVRKSDTITEARCWQRFFFAFALVPLGFFIAVSLVKPVLPHWGLIGAVGLMPILGESWADRLEKHPRQMRRRLTMVTAATVAVTALAVLQSRSGLLQAGRAGPFALIPAKSDPTRDLIGWELIVEEIRKRGFLERPNTFVFTGHWHLSGQLSLALGPEVPVLCYHEGDARGFASWSRPSQWVGFDGILVAVDDRSTEPQCYDRWFDQIEPIARFKIKRGGVSIRSVRLYLCHRQTQPFPFNSPPGAKKTASELQMRAIVGSSRLMMK